MTGIHFACTQCGRCCRDTADRPLVCRIYPAEINPFIPLRPANKACPPEAWSGDRPILQHGGQLSDATLRDDVYRSRSADAQDAKLKARLCASLNMTETAMVHESVLVYSPSPAALLAAIACAGAAGPQRTRSSPWRFVSNQAQTIDDLLRGGAATLDLEDAVPGSFQLLGFTRDRLFDFRAT